MTSWSFTNRFTRPGIVASGDRWYRTLCCTVHNKQCIALAWWLLCVCICGRIKDIYINTTFCGTALLYPICRNEKERQRSHCSLSKIPVWRRKSRNNPTPPRSVRYGVPFPNIRISWPLVPKYVCLFVCYYCCCFCFCFSFICRHDSSYYLERRIRKVMVVLTIWLVKMVVVAAAAIIILIRVC